MKTFIIKKVTITVGIIFTLFSFSFISKKLTEMRIIEIAGLVINAQSLTPISSAKIYDSNNNVLGVTDDNGYFKITINYAKEGPIKFKYKITSKDFNSFVQSENWGDLQHNTKSIIYIGLSNSNDSNKSFSKIALNGNDLSYTSVFENFNEIKKGKEFNGKLGIAKAGNEDVLLRVDEKLFIVSNSGWIQINSVDDLVSINNNRVLKANELNSALKRRDIKSMTPVDSKEEKFAIYTGKSMKPSGN